MTDNFVVKDSGVREEYNSGMRRDTQEGKPDYTLIHIPFLRRLANHLVLGAKKYGENNWMLASSPEELKRFKKSALRHMMQWLEGDMDEDHMAAVCFNLMAAEYVKEKIKNENKEGCRTYSRKSFSWTESYINRRLTSIISSSSSWRS